MTIAVQGAIGAIGQKATTVLSNYNFGSICSINGLSLGIKKDNGLFLLNSGTTDADDNYLRKVVFATTDLGAHNPKRVRFVYVGIDTSTDFVLSVKFDDQDYRDYTVPIKKTGLQRVRVPVGRDGQGRYVTIGISSMHSFRLDSVNLSIYVRSTGIVGY
jgi:hypothetical protein